MCITLQNNWEKKFGYLNFPARGTKWVKSRKKICYHLRIHLDNPCEIMYYQVILSILFHKYRSPPTVTPAKVTQLSHMDTFWRSKIAVSWYILVGMANMTPSACSDTLFWLWGRQCRQRSEYININYISSQWIGGGDTTCQHPYRRWLCTWICRSSCMGLRMTWLMRNFCGHRSCSLSKRLSIRLSQGPRSQVI